MSEAIGELQAVVWALLSLYLAVVGAWDLRTRCIPNGLILPGVGLVTAWRVVRVILAGRCGWPVLPEMGFLVYWAGVWALWMARVVGGGDAKVLMFLFGAFPTLQFLALLLTVTGGAMAAVLVWRYARRRRLGLLLWGFLFRLTSWQLFPTQAELAAEGEPTAFLFAAAGIGMVLLLSL